MSLKIALQIDPLEGLNTGFDSSLLLAWEAQNRGYKVSYFLPQDLSYEGGNLYAQVQDLQINKVEQDHIPSKGGKKRVGLNEFDVILIRQNPPFDMAYITNTYLLDHIASEVLFINHPRGIRNAVEKLLPLNFQDYIPPTLISQNWGEIEAFCEIHGDTIIKPLYDYGGNSVFRAKSGEGQLKFLFQIMQRAYPHLPFIIQSFIEEVIQGDKRIILFDGEIIGAFRRVPAKGQIRANMLMGGTPAPYTVNERDIEICGAIKETLKEMGLFFVGLDIIGPYLTEINVTSPTGLIPLNQLNKLESERIFWDKVESIIMNKGKNGSQYYNSRISGNRRSTH